MSFKEMQASIADSNVILIRNSLVD